MTWTAKFHNRYPNDAIDAERAVLAVNGTYSNNTAKLPSREAAERLVRMLSSKFRVAGHHEQLIFRRRETDRLDMTIVYKVVRMLGNKLVSAVMAHSTIAVNYPIGEWVSSPTPLYAFNNFADAECYRQGFLDWKGGYCIFTAEAELSLQKPKALVLWCSTDLQRDIQEFWQNPENFMHANPPAGTVLVSRIRLLST